MVPIDYRSSPERPNRRRLLVGLSLCVVMAVALLVGWVGLSYLRARHQERAALARMQVQATAAAAAAAASKSASTPPGRISFTREDVPEMAATLVGRRVHVRLTGRRPTPLDLAAPGTRVYVTDRSSAIVAISIAELTAAGPTLASGQQIEVVSDRLPDGFVPESVHFETRRDGTTFGTSVPLPAVGH